MSLGNDELYLARRASIKLNIAERDNPTVKRRKREEEREGGEIPQQRDSARIKVSERKREETKAIWPYT